MKFKSLVIILALLVLAGNLIAEDDAKKPDEKKTAPDQAEKVVINPISAKSIELKTEDDKISYFIGMQIGNQIMRNMQDMDLNIAALLKGFEDVLRKVPPALDQEESKAVMQTFQKKMQAKQQEMMEKQKKQAAENIEIGKKFLDENKTKKGVKSTDSGLQYEVIREGAGPIPTAADTVKVHYEGKLLDGTTFDSSYKRSEPSEFGVTGVIKGWTEALQIMKTGAKYKLYIPADLAYGERGRPNIPPNSVLIFDVELLEIVKKESKPIEIK